MSKYTKQDIIHLAEEEDVEFIRLQFTDIFGTLKNMAITVSQLEKALNNDCLFNGSGIDGFVQNEDSDRYLYPDLDTFEIFPWRPQQGKVARMICDIYTAERVPFEGDSRYVLRRALQEAKEMGYEFFVGPECEFFLFHSDDDGQPTTFSHEKAGYFDVGPVDLGENARRDIVLNLEKMNFVVLSSHHEKARAQHEIDFRYDEALATADNVVTFKMAARSIARRHGLHATFMPKPKTGENGSGMHTNMALFKDGKNAFYDPEDENGLSREAYWFIGGLMEHIRGMALIANPLVNSYKRLVRGFEAPVYSSWSAKNRSSLIRIPVDRGGKTKLELRNPDPCANPYLLFASCLWAGLDGIKRKIEPPKPLDNNMLSLSDEELIDKGVELLPSSLGEAIAEFERDEYLKEKIGSYISSVYVESKKEEWKEYRTQVSEWEIETYLSR